MELTSIKEFLDKNNIQLPVDSAEIKPGDPAISGGRKLVQVKNNQLFTGRFDEKDATTFLSIWKQYQQGNTRALRQELMGACKAINSNYNREVCPFEIMLYTSNIISSSFTNPRLVEDVADVIYQIWKDNTFYIDSIAYIVKTWRWTHVINICSVAIGRIGDGELLRYIYDNYHYVDETRFCCFEGLMVSKNEEFVPEILDMVRELEGATDIERRIGKYFKNYFILNYPEYYGRLSKKMFENSSNYVKSIVSKMLDSDNSQTFVGRYSNAKTQAERKAIVEEGFTKLFHSSDHQGLYDVINMFKEAHSNEVSERLFEKMDISHKQGLRREVVNATISYFNTIYYEPAIDRLEHVRYNDSYYAAARLALFHQGKITADELMESFLSESRTDQLKTYISGFYGMSQRGNEIQDSSFRYLSRELTREQLSRSIANYEKLIRKYRHLYDANVISLFFEWFGYKTVFNTSRISIADQTSCLNIIDAVIDASNFKKYESFLYYVAEEGTSFNYTVSNRARRIIDSGPNHRIKR